ncbi:polysaccharide biosynthesis tyrosine autokinase [Rapidithrix thailandica]|uniref:non-specific protein-tyrosine kinase n=1 Tax=Rapidithrix thailandica TaxID=413964 RepID=A0AAW9SFI4_9BACT
MNKQEEIIIEAEETINTRDIINKIINRWYYFAVSIPLFITLAFIYNRYSKSVYSVHATILVKDEGKSGLGGDFLEGLDLFKSQRNISNEIGILSSFTLVHRTIKELDFKISYFAKGSVKTSEMYRKSPYIIALLTDNNSLDNLSFSIELTNNDKIKLIPFEKNKLSFPLLSSYSFETPIIINSDTLIISRSKEKINSDEELYFTVNNLNKLTEDYRKRLKISPTDKESSILELSIEGHIVEKEKNFLNSLCDVYIKREVEEKNIIAGSTIDFINQQLIQITDSLQDIEEQLETFRRKEKIIDISLMAENALSQLEKLETEKAVLEVNDKYYNYLLKYLQQNINLKNIIAPTSLGINDPLLNELILELKKLYSEKIALAYSVTEKDYTLQRLNLQISNAKSILVENVRNILQTSKIALKNIEQRIVTVQSTINKLPKKERSLVQLQRKFNLSDNLYNYLLEKKAEAGIAKASNTSDNKILDKARPKSQEPISPKKQKIYVFSFFLGLLIPIGIIFIKEYFNDKIETIDQIEKNTNVPLLGSIIHKQNNTSIIINSPKSILAESFRALRLNLQYMTPDKSYKVIGFTSTISGEGKTFCASNLSTIIALSGKKTIIIGADLRKPMLVEYFNVSKQIGLSNYLIHNASLEEIIQETNVENLDMISSGPIPPNPAELLDSYKMEGLINQLTEVYDYIIIDAPPVGLVSDYFTLNKYIDINLYVIRQSYSKVHFLQDLDKAHKAKKFCNLALIFNDLTSHVKYGGYYNGYASGYYDEDTGQKKLLDTIKKLFKNS